MLWTAPPPAVEVTTIRRELFDVVADPDDDRVPDAARECVAALGAQLRMLKAQILEFDRRIMAWHRSNETSKRLDEIPGVGPVLATALRSEERRVGKECGSRGSAGNLEKRYHV